MDPSCWQTKIHANSGEFLFQIKSQDLAGFFLKKSKLVGDFSPTHLKKYDRQIGSFPPILGMNMQKYLSCHHPGKVLIKK